MGLLIVLQCSLISACTCTCTNLLQKGCTALYFAAKKGHEDVVELLLEAKADPELKKKVIKKSGQVGTD